MSRLGRELEDAEALDARDTPPTRFWEEQQHELVISVVDYNLRTIADLVESKTIDMSPQYQRRLRWGVKKQSQLIESFLMNVPVPTIYLNEDSYGNYSVIDGKQRLNAVHSFMTGRLRLRYLDVFSAINGSTYEDLPREFQAVIATRPTLRAVIVLSQSSPDIKYEVFWRLNTGGVNLNAQEIRNSAFAGPFNDLIMELAVTERFHKLLRIKNRARSAIYQEMRDAELVLRYLTFREAWESFTGGVQRQLDVYMETHRDPGERFLEVAEADFSRVLENVEQSFGETAFRRWAPETGRWRDQVLAALIDSQMLACHQFARVQWRASREDFLRDYRVMFENSHFREAIDAATNTPALLKRRVQMTLALLRAHTIEA